MILFSQNNIKAPSTNDQLVNQIKEKDKIAMIYDFISCDESNKSFVIS